MYVIHAFFPCSFHVGSGCQTPLAYQSALELSAELFRYAASIGVHFSLLDIGGGFPGDRGSDTLFREVACSINEGLATYFSCEEFPSLRIIAEPGWYRDTSGFSRVVSCCLSVMCHVLIFSSFPPSLPLLCLSLLTSSPSPSSILF